MLFTIYRHEGYIYIYIYIYIYKGQDQVILGVNFRNVTPLNFLLDVNFKKFIVGLHFLLITFMHMKF